MRSAKILSVAIPLIFFSVSLVATSVSAGPLPPSLRPLYEVRLVAKELLRQAGSLLQEFQAISSVQAVLDHLTEFENGLNDLGGKIEALAQIGKIKVSDAKFVEIRIALCNAKVGLVEQASTITLVESSVRCYAASGVYLAVKTYSDGRREIVKVALIR